MERRKIWKFINYYCNIFIYKPETLTKKKWTKFIETMEFVENHHYLSDSNRIKEALEEKDYLDLLDFANTFVELNNNNGFENSKKFLIENQEFFKDCYEGRVRIV